MLCLKARDRLEDLKKMRFFSFFFLPPPPLFFFLFFLSIRRARFETVTALKYGT